MMANHRSVTHRVPQVAVLRDLCLSPVGRAQVCEYADLWHPAAFYTWRVRMTNVDDRKASAWMIVRLGLLFVLVGVSIENLVMIGFHLELQAFLWFIISCL